MLVNEGFGRTSNELAACFKIKEAANRFFYLFPREKPELS
jgi:hypothetical protein